jgi:hypothetical protein
MGTQEVEHHMKIHTIFQGGPVGGILASVTVVTSDGKVPTEVRLAKGLDAMTSETGKVQGYLYSLDGEPDTTIIPGQVMAQYTYSGDYNDLPTSLVDYVF